MDFTLLKYFRCGWNELVRKDRGVSWSRTLLDSCAASNAPGKHQAAELSQAFQRNSLSLGLGVLRLIIRRNRMERTSVVFMQQLVAWPIG